MKKADYKKNKMFERGFSLVEVLISVTVLFISISAVSLLMASNIRNSQISRDQIIASELAQEGIELVRNLKDNKAPQLTAGDPSVLADGNYDDYRIDKSMSAVDTVTANTKRLYIDSDNFYTHTVNTATKFYRKIQLDIDHTSAKQVIVTSYVIWGGTTFPATCNIANKCISIVSVLPDQVN